MSAMLGLAMVFAAILVGRVSMVGVRMQPPPWWATDNMSAFLLSPGIVTLMAAGIASLLSWLLGGDWRATNLFTAAGLAAIVAVYVVLTRWVRAWGTRVRAAQEQPAPAANEDDPRRPPGVPPLRKAA